MKNLPRFLAITLLVSLLIPACTLPSYQPESQAAPAEEESAGTDPTPTWTPSPAPAAVVDCSPTLVANTVANVRGGPGTDYNIVGSLPQGASAAVAGKNQDGT